MITDDDYRSDSAPHGLNPIRVPLLPVPVATHGSENHALQPPQRANGPTRSKSAKWRRPQCPDKRRALARYQMSSGNSPSRIASCRQRHRNHRSAKLRILTFSLETLCGRTLRTAIENLFRYVQKLWRMPLPCGKLRKTPEEITASNHHRPPADPEERIFHSRLTYTEKWPFRFARNSA